MLVGDGSYSTGIVSSACWPIGTDRRCAPPSPAGAAGVEVVIAAPAALHVFLLYGRQGAGPSQRFQSTTSRAGVGSPGSQQFQISGT